MRLILERTDEIFTSNGGFVLAGALMKSLNVGRGLASLFHEVCAAQMQGRKTQLYYNTPDSVKAFAAAQLCCWLRLAVF